MLHCQHPDPSCNFCSFVYNFSQDPSSNSHVSMQHYHHDSSPSVSCNFCGSLVHCQHNSFPDPSCNFCGFVHYFSPALSCSCHGFMVYCQHGSSLNFLIICLLIVSYLLIVCRVVQLLKYYTRSLSS